MFQPSPYKHYIRVLYNRYNNLSEKFDKKYRISTIFRDFIQLQVFKTRIARIPFPVNKNFAKNPICPAAGVYPQSLAGIFSESQTKCGGKLYILSNLMIDEAKFPVFDSSNKVRSRCSLEKIRELRLLSFDKNVVI